MARFSRSMHFLQVPGRYYSIGGRSLGKVGVRSVSGGGNPIDSATNASGHPDWDRP